MSNPYSRITEGTQDRNINLSGRAFLGSSINTPSNASSHVHGTSVRVRSQNQPMTINSSSSVTTTNYTTAFNAPSLSNLASATRHQIGLDSPSSISPTEPLAVVSPTTYKTELDQNTHYRPLPPIASPKALIKGTDHYQKLIEGTTSYPRMTQNTFQARIASQDVPPSSSTKSESGLATSTSASTSTFTSSVVPNTKPLSLNNLILSDDSLDNQTMAMTSSTLRQSASASQNQRHVDDEDFDRDIHRQALPTPTVQPSTRPTRQSNIEHVSHDTQYTSTNRRASYDDGVALNHVDTEHLDLDTIVPNSKPSQMQMARYEQNMQTPKTKKTISSYSPPDNHHENLMTPTQAQGRKVYGASKYGVKSDLPPSPDGFYSPNALDTSKFASPVRKSHQAGFQPIPFEDFKRSKNLTKPEGFDPALGSTNRSISPISMVDQDQDQFRPPREVFLDNSFEDESNRKASFSLRKSLGRQSFLERTMLEGITAGGLLTMLDDEAMSVAHPQPSLQVTKPSVTNFSSILGNAGSFFGSLLGGTGTGTGSGTTSSSTHPTSSDRTPSTHSYNPPKETGISHQDMPNFFHPDSSSEMETKKHHQMLTLNSANYGQKSSVRSRPASSTASVSRNAMISNPLKAQSQPYPQNSALTGVQESSVVPFNRGSSGNDNEEESRTASRLENPAHQKPLTGLAFDRDRSDPLALMTNMSMVEAGAGVGAGVGSSIGAVSGATGHEVQVDNDIAAIFGQSREGSGQASNIRVMIRPRPLSAGLDFEAETRREGYDDHAYGSAQRPESKGFGQEKIGCLQIDTLNNVIRVSPADNQTPSSAVSSAVAAAQSPSFRFDNVVQTTASQSDVFEKVGRPLADQCLSGFNATIFTYGQTGSGKTHTMMGDLHFGSLERGLMPRIFTYMFEKINRATNQYGDMITFDCTCSFFEVYNDSVTDLIASSGSSRDNSSQVRLNDRRSSVTSVVVIDKQDCLILLRSGLENRKKAETLMNKDSSRSHAVYTLSISSKLVNVNEGGPSTQVRSATFTLVDLAGSEQVKKSGVTDLSKKEAIHINSSLSGLLRVITSLHEKNTKPNTHVPYRDNVLTLILEKSLGSNCMTTVIACVSPALSSYAETKNTLSFAKNASKVTSNVHANLTVHEERLTEQEYIKQNQRLLSIFHTIRVTLRRSLHFKGTKTQLQGMLLDEYSRMDFLSPTKKSSTSMRLEYEQNKESEYEDDNDQQHQHSKTGFRSQHRGTSSRGRRNLVPNSSHIPFNLGDDSDSDGDDFFLDDQHKDAFHRDVNENRAFPRLPPLEELRTIYFQSHKFHPTDAESAATTSHQLDYASLMENLTVRRLLRILFKKQLSFTKEQVALRTYADTIKHYSEALFSQNAAIRMLLSSHRELFFILQQKIQRIEQEFRRVKDKHGIRADQIAQIGEILGDLVINLFPQNLARFSPIQSPSGSLSDILKGILEKLSSLDSNYASHPEILRYASQTQALTIEMEDLKRRFGLAMFHLRPDIKNFGALPQQSHSRLMVGGNDNDDNNNNGHNGEENADNGFTSTDALLHDFSHASFFTLSSDTFRMFKLLQIFLTNHEARLAHMDPIEGPILQSEYSSAVVAQVQSENLRLKQQLSEKDVRILELEKALAAEQTSSNHLRKRLNESNDHIVKLENDLHSCGLASSHKLEQVQAQASSLLSEKSSTKRQFEQEKANLEDEIRILRTDLDLLKRDQENQIASEGAHFAKADLECELDSARIKNDGLEKMLSDMRKATSLEISTLKHNSELLQKQVDELASANRNMEGLLKISKSSSNESVKETSQSDLPSLLSHVIALARDNNNLRTQLLRAQMMITTEDSDKFTKFSSMKVELSKCKDDMVILQQKLSTSELFSEFLLQSVHTKKSSVPSMVTMSSSDLSNDSAVSGPLGTKRRQDLHEELKPVYESYSRLQKESELLRESILCIYHVFEALALHFIGDVSFEDCFSILKSYKDADLKLSLSRIKVMEEQAFNGDDMLNDKPVFSTAPTITALSSNGTSSSLTSSESTFLFDMDELLNGSVTNHQMAALANASPEKPIQVSLKPVPCGIFKISFESCMALAEKVLNNIRAKSSMNGNHMMHRTSAKYATTNVSNPAPHISITSGTNSSIATTMDSMGARRPASNQTLMRSNLSNTLRNGSMSNTKLTTGGQSSIPKPKMNSTIGANRFGGTGTTKM